MGSSRSGCPGKASASAVTAAISSSGGKTPPLSLKEVKPYRSVNLRACSTIPAGSTAAPQSSFSEADALGVGGPLVEEVRAVLDGVPHLAAEQRVHGQAERLAEGVEAGDLEAGDDGQPQLVGGLDAAQPADVDLAGDPGGVDGDLVRERRTGRSGR